MGIKIRIVSDPLDARAICRRLREISGKSHPAYKDFEFRVYHGALGLVLERNDEPLSIHCSYLGKRKTGIDEPYVNWYISYTIPESRRKGYATKLWKEVEDKAQEAGCRRVKSLAGSYGGVWLHFSLGQAMWGRMESGALLVDHHLPKFEKLYKPEHLPRNVRYNKFSRRMTKTELIEAVKEGLQYPKEEE